MTNIMGGIAERLRDGAPSTGAAPAKTVRHKSDPLDRKGRRAMERRQTRYALSHGQQRWRSAFRGIITVAEARRLSEIDARPGNQRKGAGRRRRRAAARRQMMPPKLRYVAPEVRFLLGGRRG